MTGRLATGLALCLGISSTAAPAAIVWGVNGHPLTAYPGIAFEEQLDLAKGMNATSYRVNISFADQAPELERLVEVAKQRGITIMPVLTPGDIDMERDSAEDLYRKTRDFAVALGERFKEDIPVWELGNELENFAILQPCEQRDDGTTYPCDWGAAGGVGRLDYYGPRWVKVSAVLRGLTEGIASVDPTLRKAVGTAGWGHLGAFERMAEDGIQWEISVWHAYGQDPEWAFRHLAKYGRPIWLTEYNHPVGSRDGDAAMAYGLRQMMIRLIELEDRYDIGGAHIYELLDEPYWAPSFEATMGLVPLGPTANGGWETLPPRPAYHVVRDIAAGYVAPCDLEAAAALQPLASGQAAYAHCLVLGAVAPPATWAEALAGGHATVPEMLESLVRSPDFVARHAPAAMDDAEYITRVYRLLLRREPDGEGLRSYGERLADGSLTRQQLALAAMHSTEFADRHPLLFQRSAADPAKTEIVARDCDLAMAGAAAAPERRAAYAYCLLLGRDPDASEIDAAAQVLDGGASTADLLRTLIESPEFAARYQLATLSDPDFVSLAYRLLLDREADGVGRDNYAAALGNGALTREALALAITESNEFYEQHPALVAPAVAAPSAAPPRLRPRDCDLGAAAAISTPPERRVAYAHCLILGTPAPAEALQGWASGLEASETAFGDLLDSFIRSDDFTARYDPDSLSDGEFVVLAYEVLLGRQPDGLGLQVYTDQLANGSLSRGDILRGVIWSSEFAEQHRALAE